MHKQLKYIHILTAIATATLLLTSCGGHSDHDHGPATTEAETGHEEAPATIASLTPEQVKAVGIAYGSVEMKELTATVKANGFLRVPNNNRASVTSLYGGVIRTLDVRIGDHVRKGQVIATIANPQFIALQEEYLSVSDRIVYAGQELARQQELNEGNAGARRNLQSAETDLKTLRTRKASLHQQLRLMGIDPTTLSNENLRAALRIESPISGTVSNLFATIGSYVDVSAPVAEIVDNSQLHLDLQVFERDLPAIRVGQAIQFTLTNNPDKQYEAEVFTISSAFENDSKTIPVHCTVKGSKAGLIDGMNITGTVSLSNVRSQAVPTAAIVNADGKDYIFVITDKTPEDHHEEGETHDHEAEAGDSGASDVNTINFEKIEVLKGVTNLGYTAITPVTDLPADARIVVQGAYFVNAKLVTPTGHQH